MKRVHQTGFILVEEVVAMSINDAAHSGSDIFQNWTHFNLPQTVPQLAANIYIKKATSCP